MTMKTSYETVIANCTYATSQVMSIYDHSDMQSVHVSKMNNRRSTRAQMHPPTITESIGTRILLIGITSQQLQTSRSRAHLAVLRTAAFYCDTAHATDTLAVLQNVHLYFVPVLKLG
jgi:hypothetical protein